MSPASAGLIISALAAPRRSPGSSRIASLKSALTSQLEGLLQTLLGESAAGCRLQITFEGYRFRFIGESDVRDKAPRFEFRGVWRMAGVVGSQSRFEIVGQSDVGFVGMLDTLGR